MFRVWAGVYVFPMSEKDLEPDNDGAGMTEGDIHSGPGGYEGMGYSGGYAAKYFASDADADLHADDHDDADDDHDTDDHADHDHEVVPERGEAGDRRGEVLVPVDEEAEELVEAGHDRGDREAEVQDLPGLIGWIAPGRHFYYSEGPPRESICSDTIAISFWFCYWPGNRN